MPTTEVGLKTKTFEILINTSVKLAKDEEYSGIMLLNGRPDHHLILLPGEELDIDWKKSGAWAKKQHKDGRLPTRPEQRLLMANLAGSFKPRAYWSSEQSAGHGSWAWYQDFDDGNQSHYDKDWKFACRAVRSVAI